jgi:hypothetical protein
VLVACHWLTCGNKTKLREVPKDVDYQTVNESLQWLRKTNSGMVKRSRMKIDLSKRKDHKETLVSLEMDNPQPSSYGRNDKTMEKVQRLNGFGSERFNLPLWRSKI